MDGPITIGGRECYRLSRPIAAVMRVKKSDSPEITWFSFILISTVIRIVYSISNICGSSPRFNSQFVGSVVARR